MTFRIDTLCRTWFHFDDEVFIGLSYLLLPFNDVRELRVGDPGVQLTLHEGRPLVVFDVAQVATLRHFNVFGKALRGANALLAGRHGGGEVTRTAHAGSTCFLK